MSRMQTFKASNDMQQCYGGSLCKLRVQTQFENACVSIILHVPNKYYHGMEG